VLLVGGHRLDPVDPPTADALSALFPLDGAY
jgi:hypothetical protein